MEKEQQDQRDGLLEQCKNAGLRRTNALCVLLETLLVHELPMTLATTEAV